MPEAGNFCKDCDHCVFHKNADQNNRTVTERARGFTTDITLNYKNGAID